MVHLIVRGIRRVRRKYISDNFFALPMIRKMYRLLLRRTPFLERTGIPIDIGGLGYFKLHPELAIGAYNYEEWGKAHNAGFRAWVEACRDKKVVFDIGAHIGLYALPASKVLAPQGRLYAFEPAKGNRELFKRHIQYNKISNIEVMSDLVGNEQKQGVQFFETDLVHGMNTIVQESVVHKSGALQFHRVLKNQICLDDFCRERGIKPEIMKIDVEGGELRVLQGARNVLEYARPLIFLSVHPTHLQHLGTSVRDLEKLLHTVGYAAYDQEGKRSDKLSKAEYILRPIL